MSQHASNGARADEHPVLLALHAEVQGRYQRREISEELLAEEMDSYYQAKEMSALEVEARLNCQNPAL